MKDITQLVDQNILEYESHRTHIDELLARAHERIGEGPEHADARSHLEELAKKRNALSDQLDGLKRRNPDDWKEEEIEKSGLMGIWYALAQDAEKLVERLEK